MTRILSLDDQPVLLELFHLILERAGFEHSHTTSSDEALFLLKRKRHDLFTQDCMRPGTDGIGFYQQMKADADLRTIPVLFISCYQFDPAFMADCRQRYGDEFLRKPCTPHELLSTVRRVLVSHGKYLPEQSVEL